MSTIPERMAIVETRLTILEQEMSELSQIAKSLSEAYLEDNAIRQDRRRERKSGLSTLQWVIVTFIAGCSAAGALIPLFR